MGIGIKIKEYRTKSGLTQKELADKLHVTFQAVSRWENDDVEPSFETLKEMSKLFDCTIDDLFGIDKSNKESEKEVKVIEKTIVKESDPILGVCERCGKPIRKNNDLKKVELSERVGSGKWSHFEKRTHVYCNECNNKRIKEEREEADRRQKSTEAYFRKRRIHSYVWSSIVAVVLAIVSIVCFANGNTGWGIGAIVGAVFGFTFTSCMILDNTFIPELWLTVSSWGFVKLPGIIFEFSIEGFIFLIVLKILFWILGIILALLVDAFATVLAMALSIFVYPFALIKSYKCEE